MQQALLLPLKPKLPRSCRRFLQRLRLPYKTAITTALGFRHLRRAAPPKKKPGRRRRTQPSFLPFLCRSFSSIKSAEMDELGELVSMPETARGAAAPFPSPLTPAYARLRRAAGGVVDGAEALDDVEEACRSFENYLVEMIVEEGELKDLTDVEELLYCWDNLKDPLFVELVSRFYGELCRDLFSEHDDEAAE